jgi:WD40 repeat protein
MASDPAPLARPERPPSHLDRAKKNGSSALPDGPAEVAALALTADGKVLGIGYADGTVRLWPLDQPTFEAMQPGPRADGPVVRVQFDRNGRFVFAHTATGAFAAPRAGPPPVVTKIPGTLVAVAPEAGERVRFAAVRGNAIIDRLLDAEFVRDPPLKGKMPDYVIPNPKSDEIIPRDHTRDPARPPGPTFLAWGPGDRLLAGQPNGTVSAWSAAMRPEAPINDHKAAVRAWASCPATGGFATGDEKGNLALWPTGGGRPVLWPVFGAAPITGLSFDPAGSRLAVADDTGRLVIWDVVAGKAVHRVQRPAPVKALAYGPGDNMLVLAAGRTAEVWWLPELLK